jgi:hypothetical protein
MGLPARRHTLQTRPTCRQPCRGTLPLVERRGMGGNRYAVRRTTLEREDDQRSRWSMPMWWACQDLNLGPHPYQVSRAQRCAERRFPRSPVSVRGEGMRSNASTGNAPGGGYDSSHWTVRRSSPRGVPRPARGFRPLGSGGARPGSSRRAVCLPWPSGTRSWARREGYRPPRRYGGSWGGGCGLAGGWAATAHPFRATDPSGGAGPGGGRLFVRHRR